MKTPPKLLVVTPTLGVSPFLAGAVAAVRAIAGVDLQYLIVCPSSEIGRLQREYPDAAVVADQGRAGGIYGAVNAGLAAARPGWEWFTYLNDDDLLTPGFSRLLARHCRPENAAAVAYGDIANIDAAGRPLGRMTVESDPRRIPALLQQGISPLGQQGMLFGEPVVRALGGYRLDFKLCADLDFWARALAADFRFVYYPWTVGRFRIQAGQLSGDIARTRRELDRVTAESFPRPASALVRRLARWNYRLRNAPRYLERWRSLGRLATSETLLDGGLNPAPRAASTPPNR